MDFAQMINAVGIFLRVGFITSIFHCSYKQCTEKIEFIKENKTRHAYKCNHVLMLTYLTIFFAMYTLMSWGVVLLIIFGLMAGALFGIQNMRPDLLDCLNPINKNSTLKFVCRILISIYTVLFNMYGPVITLCNKKFTYLFSKLTQMDNSEIMDNMTNIKNLYKSHEMSSFADKLTSLENYLCSSSDGLNENPRSEINDEIKNKIIEETTNEVNKVNEVNVVNVVNEVTVDEIK